MSLKLGIVGLPNVGKSTLFNSLVGTNLAAASNFPFCTIEPNTGIVPVPDSRLDKLAEIEKSKKVVPTTIEFVDIAGLVAGASQGQGLGNKFLSHIREVDAIIQVVRIFEDSNIIHVTGDINPISDIETINLELALCDLDQATSSRDRLTKTARSGDKLAVVQLTVLDKVVSGLEQSKPIRTIGLTPEELHSIKSFNFLTAKPMLYVANMSEGQLGNASLLEPIKSAVGGNIQVLPISAQVESELLGLSSADQVEYLASLGLTEPGLNRLIRAGYQLLGLITFFTAGEQESRAWTLPVGSTAPNGAGAIHTDFEKGFIRAETVSYEDFVAGSGWTGAKEAGKVRSEGKTYIVQDGDVMLFRFNV